MHLLSILTYSINAIIFLINSAYAIIINQTSKNHKSITLNINAYQFNFIHFYIMHTKIQQSSFNKITK